MSTLYSHVCTFTRLQYARVDSSLWIFALWRLSEAAPGLAHYNNRARQLVADIHPHFFVPHRGIWWKMKEDLSGPAQGKIYAISRSGCITYMHMCTHRSHTYM